MSKLVKQIAEAILYTKAEDYLRALLIFDEAYGSEDVPSLQTVKLAQGLSYFGVCLALVRKQHKNAIDLCRRAIDLEFYNPDHYANLGRVYLAAGNRKKALETVEAGLKLNEHHDGLLAVRKMLGVRSRPTVPFLDRSHPINVSLGQSRHAKKVEEEEKRKPRRRE